MPKTKGIHIHDTLRVAIILSMIGGYIDSLCYSLLGGHFASLQSGNLIMLGINLSNGNYRHGLSYLVPLGAFTLGAGSNFFVRQKLAHNTPIIWQEWSVLFELIGMLIIAIFAPYLPTLLVIGGLAFFSALQADSFTVVHGTPYATLMSTGNVKTFGSNLIQYLVTRNHDKLVVTLRFFFILFAFFIGAYVAHFLGNILQLKALYGTCLLLLITCILLHFDLDANKNREQQPHTKTISSQNITNLN